MQSQHFWKTSEYQVQSGTVPFPRIENVPIKIKYLHQIKILILFILSNKIYSGKERLGQFRVGKVRTAKVRFGQAQEQIINFYFIFSASTIRYRAVSRKQACHETNLFNYQDQIKKRFKFFLFSATKSTQDQAEDDQGGLGAIQGSEEGPGEAARVRIIIWEGLKIWERDLDTFCFGIIILGDG